uniref:embryonal Fyn-associated substrate-like isoform X2 n=1 Tax=Myxine glutinosa TaxID=7769 RepID=UPI00358FFF44
MPLSNVLAKATFDNKAESPDELSFRKGDIVTVLENPPNDLHGWLLCSLRGVQGIAPANRLRIISWEYDNVGGARPAAISTETPSSDQTVYQVPKLQRESENGHDLYDVPGSNNPEDSLYQLPSFQVEQDESIYQVPKGDIDCVESFYNVPSQPKHAQESKEDVVDGPFKISKPTNKVEPRPRSPAFPTVRATEEGNYDNIYVSPSNQWKRVMNKEENDDNIYDSPSNQWKRGMNKEENDDNIYDSPSSQWKRGMNKEENDDNIYDSPSSQWRRGMNKEENDDNIYDSPASTWKCAMKTEQPGFPLSLQENFESTSNDDIYDVPPGWASSSIPPNPRSTNEPVTQVMESTFINTTCVDEVYDIPPFRASQDNYSEIYDIPHGPKSCSTDFCFTEKANETQTSTPHFSAAQSQNVNEESSGMVDLYDIPQRVYAAIQKKDDVHNMPPSLSLEFGGALHPTESANMDAMQLGNQTRLLPSVPSDPANGHVGNSSDEYDYVEDTGEVSNESLGVHCTTDMMDKTKVNAQQYVTAKSTNGRNSVEHSPLALLSASSLPRYDRKLLRFYAEQSEAPQAALVQASEACIACLSAESSMPKPRQIIEHGRTLILKGHKLAFLSDAVARYSRSSQLRTAASASADSVSGRLRRLAAVSKQAAGGLAQAGDGGMALRDEVVRHVAELAVATKDITTLLEKLALD